MIIKNGMVFLPEEGFVKKDIQMKDGKILKISDSILNDQGVKEYDASGQYVMPGMIDAHSHIGLFNEAMRWEGEDGNEGSDPVTADMNAMDAINPFDESFVLTKGPFCLIVHSLEHLNKLLKARD